MGKAANVRHFFTKVAGVTHDNDDGTSRQEIIRRCRLMEKLTLDHAEGNPHDPNAVRVCRENGEQLGFLSAELAEEVVSRSNRGYRYAAFVKDITGGIASAPTQGVNLLIIVAAPGVSLAEAQQYATSLELGPQPKKSGCAGLLAAGLLAIVVAAVRFALYQN